jgi:hypothetical protein
MAAIVDPGVRRDDDVSSSAGIATREPSGDPKVSQAMGR